MTIIDSMLINKGAPRNMEELLVPYYKEDEPFLFAVIGDLNPEAKYGGCALVVSEKRFFILDFDENKAEEYFISDVEKTTVKRLYGNAYMRLFKKDGNKKIIMRYTFSVAALMDMASSFINALAGEGNFSEEMERVEGTYEKLMRVCPKCGRTLLHPGATCIKCSSKSKAFGKFIPYIKPEVGKLIACVLISISLIIIELLPPIATKIIVDDILPKGDGLGLLKLVIFMFLCYVYHYGVMIFKNFTLRKAGARIVTRIRNDVYKKAQYLPMKFYDKTPTGQVINRISSDTGTIQTFMLNISQSALNQALLLIGIAVIMLVMNWRLTLLALIPVPFVVLIGRLFAKVIAPYYRRIWRKWARVTSILTDSIPCIRVVKAFSGEKSAVNKFNFYTNEWLKTEYKTAKIASAFPEIMGFLITIGGLAIWAIGGYWIIGANGAEVAGGLTAGTLVSFISYTSMFYTPVRYFSSLGDSYQSALASVERLLDVIDAEPEANKENGIKPENIKGKIEFKNVNFAFDKTKKVLTDVNFTIEAGDIVGIVGTTGSGKTTLINLLLRYYDNYEGQILLDGVDIRELDLQCYRDHLGYVQQEPMMFSDTIYQNIAYGDPEASPEAVMNAADVANAHGFIIKQPDGYDSMLGERGVGLSGGEKQRISIARAILKNPDILIFDEATAAVDSETESMIQSAIDNLISGRTTLMIAHRLSTLRKANRILVVDNGRIIENGSHEELMAKKGKYYKLIQIQSIGSKLTEDEIKL